MRIFAIGAVIAAICAVSAWAQTLTPSEETWVCTWTRPGDRTSPTSGTSQRRRRQPNRNRRSASAWVPYCDK
jgi:hypothetical protein